MNQKDMVAQVLKMNNDYAVSVAILAIEENYTPEEIKPMGYLKKRMAVAGPVPYEVATQFLLQFHSYDAVHDWTNQYEWPEGV